MLPSLNYLSDPAEHCMSSEEKKLYNLNLLFKPCLCTLITDTVWVSASLLCPFALQRQEREWSSFFSSCTCIWTFASNESRRTSRGHGNWSSCFIWASGVNLKGWTCPSFAKREGVVATWSLLRPIKSAKFNLPLQRESWLWNGLDWLTTLTNHWEWFCLCSTIHVFPSCPCV